MQNFNLTKKKQTKIIDYRSSRVKGLPNTYNFKKHFYVIKRVFHHFVTTTKCHKNN